MFIVVIGLPRNYQIRVIKLIRGSKILKAQTIRGREILIGCEYFYCSTRNFTHNPTIEGYKALSVIQCRGFPLLSRKGSLSRHNMLCHGASMSVLERPIFSPQTRFNEDIIYLHTVVHVLYKYGLDTHERKGNH